MIIRFYYNTASSSAGGIHQITSVFIARQILVPLSKQGTKQVVYTIILSPWTRAKTQIEVQ